MTTRLGNPALMLCVVMWGTLIGGVAYSHIVYFSVYLSALPDSAVLVTGPFALHEEVFWLALHPALIISLIAAMVVNWSSRDRRRLIGASAAVYAVILVWTSVYFVPELIAFAGSQESGIPASQWLPRAQRWETLSWVRGAACYVGFVPLLLALTRPATAK